MKRSLSALGCLLVLAATPVAAQQPAPSCEDQLRAIRVLAEQMARSRSQSELDLSQTVAALLKQIDGLRQEVDAWKAKAPKDGNEPKVGVGK